MRDRQPLAASVLLGIAVIGGFALRVWWAMLPPERSCVILRDDAYYYLEVARNISQGLGPTFDGINQTNGFHPLWLLVLTGLFKLFPGLVAGFRATIVLEALIFAATGLLLFMWLRRTAGVWPAVVAVVAFQLPQFAYMTRTGMESALAALLLAAILAWDAGDVGRRSQGHWWLAGLLLGLLVLARLDCALLVVAAVIAVVLKGGDGRVRQAFALTLPTVVLLGGFVAWNLANFGHISTVSAAVKSSFPHVGGSARILLREPVMLISGLVALIWLASGESLRQRGWRDAPLGLLALPIGVLLHIVHDVLFITEETLGNWHFVMYVPLLLAAPAVLWAVAAERMAWRQNVQAVAIGLLVIGAGLQNARETALYLQPDFLFTRESYRAARWCDANLPPGSIIGMTDCGAMGYFCALPVVNLDGVINSFEYLEYLRSDRVDEYLRRERIGYVAFHLVSLEPAPESVGQRIARDEAYQIPGHLRMLGPQITRFLNSDTQVYHGRPYNDGGIRGFFVVWDVRKLLEQPAVSP